MKTILVPTDFSKHSEYALEVAAKIAKEQKAEIIVLHMLGVSSVGMNTTGSSSANEAIFHLMLAEKGFKTFLKKDYLKDIKVKEKVQNFKVFSEINTLAKENNVGLVVMGSHGTSGINEDVFVGSNTEKVVRTSDTPVLIIKEKRENFKVDKVVFACDFKLENIEVYKNAKQLFNSFNADVHLLYINVLGKFRSTKQVSDRISTFFAAIGEEGRNPRDVVRYSDYSVEEGIYNYSKDVNADLITIPTHGRRGLAHFFSGSIGEDIANHAKRPVMTFKI